MARVDPGELRDIILSLCEGEVARRREHIDDVHYQVGYESNIGQAKFNLGKEFDGWYIITVDEWNKTKPASTWPQVIVGVPGMSPNGKFLTDDAAQDFVHENPKYFQYLSNYIVIHVMCVYHSTLFVIDAEYADETRGVLERINDIKPVRISSDMYDKWCVISTDTIDKPNLNPRIMGSFDKIDQALNFISKNRIHPSQVILINAMDDKYTRCFFYPDDPRLIRYKKQLEIMVRMPKQRSSIIGKKVEKIKKRNRSWAKLGWYIFSQSEFINGSGIEDSYNEKSTLYYNSDPYHDYVTAQQMAKKMLGFKDKILVFVDENSIAKGAVYSSHPADLWLHWWPFWDKHA